jgi:hypothetical protein
MNAKMRESIVRAYFVRFAAFSYLRLVAAKHPLLIAKGASEIVYLESLTSVAKADFFNSNTAGINAHSTSSL